MGGLKRVFYPLVNTNRDTAFQFYVYMIVASVSSFQSAMMPLQHYYDASLQVLR